MLIPQFHLLLNSKNRGPVIYYPFQTFFFKLTNHKFDNFCYLYSLLSTILYKMLHNLHHLKHCDNIIKCQHFNCAKYKKKSSKNYLLLVGPESPLPFDDCVFFSRGWVNYRIGIKKHLYQTIYEYVETVRASPVHLGLVSFLRPLRWGVISQVHKGSLFE